MGYLTPFQYSDCKASDGKMIAEWWIMKNLEGSGHGIVEVLSRNLLGRTRKPRKPSVRIVGVPNENQTEHHPNFWTWRPSSTSYAVMTLETFKLFFVGNKWILYHLPTPRVPAPDSSRIFIWYPASAGLSVAEVRMSFWIRSFDVWMDEYRRTFSQ